MSEKNKIFIVAGPAGVGKDTIICKISQKYPKLIMVPSYTTRPPRKSNEVGNRIFVSENEFKKMISKNEMIEWKRVHDKWYYGRRKRDIVRHIDKGQNIIMEASVDGVLSYKKKFPNVISIFVKYEKPELFEIRLNKNRPEITDCELRARKFSFSHEMLFEKYFDYSIINYENNPMIAVNNVAKIIESCLK